MTSAPNSSSGTLTGLLKRLTGGAVEKVQAPHVHPQPHTVTRVDLEVGIDAGGDRVGAHLPIDELVCPEHLRDLDLQVKVGMAIAPILAHGSMPNAEHAPVN